MRALNVKTGITYSEAYDRKNRMDEKYKKEENNLRNKEIANQTLGHTINSRDTAVREGKLAMDRSIHTLNLISLIKPLLLGGLIIALILGPGVSAIGNVLSLMPLWLWGAAIFIILIIWRRSK